MSKIYMIGGSRGVCVHTKLKLFLEENINKDDIILNGKCYDSPDTWASEYARMKGIVLGEFPYVGARGKAGGHVRNRVMVDIADVCVFVWDGKSRGTGATIEYAKRLGKEVHVIWKY